MSVIILEGIDGSGKTTLARWLEKEKGFRYHHEGVPQEGTDLFQYYTEMLWWGLHQKTGVVFDRFHLGELVYGHVVRNRDRIGGMAGFRLFQRVVSSQPVTVAVCDPGLKAVQESWRAKVEAKDDYLADGTGDFFEAQSRFFDCYYRFKGLSQYGRNVSWDYASGNETLWNWHQDHKENCPEGVVGLSPKKAKFLIVGEQVNHDKMDFPFMALVNSSKFLNESLWQAKFQESEMMFTNAKTYNGKNQDLSKVNHSCPSLLSIIALGDLAYKASKEASLPGVKIYRVEHPAYFKRFKSKTLSAYPQSLAKIRSEVLAWK